MIVRGRTENPALSRDEIAARVAELARQITADFRGEPVLFVGVLKGAAIFLSDLVRQVQLDATYDFIGVASYGNPRGPKAGDTYGIQPAKCV